MDRGRWRAAGNAVVFSALALAVSSAPVQGGQRDGSALRIQRTSKGRHPDQTKKCCYVGFDRNQYPGDIKLAALRKTFWYAGYWLNNPPNATSNTWLGKRRLLQSKGFGFLVLFAGRPYAELKAAADPGAAGKSDAAAGVGAAKREGFPSGTIIFLDLEEGGRLLPEQRAYVHAWVDGVNASHYRAGIYCSGMAPEEPGGSDAITATDIHDQVGGRRIVYWVYNVACPPSPGCVFSSHPPEPTGSGVSFARVWQFAQSPMGKGAAACRSSYAADGNCYAPGLGPGDSAFLDVNTATSPDPSHGRGR